MPRGAAGTNATSFGSFRCLGVGKAEDAAKRSAAERVAPRRGGSEPRVCGGHLGAAKGCTSYLEVSIGSRHRGRTRQLFGELARRGDSSASSRARRTHVGPATLRRACARGASAAAARECTRDDFVALRCPPRHFGPRRGGAEAFWTESRRRGNDLDCPWVGCGVAAANIRDGPAARVGTVRGASGPRRAGRRGGPRRAGTAASGETGDGPRRVGTAASAARAQVQVLARRHGLPGPHAQRVGRHVCGFRAMERHDQR